MLDDTPIHNPKRDKAWEAFIKRKDVKALMKGKESFKFPLDGSYDLWCVAWETAWGAGFVQGYNVNVETVDEDLEITESDWVGLRGMYLLLAIDTSSAMSEEVLRIVDYYTNKYGSNKVLGVLRKLARDNANRGTFSAPDVMWARNLDKSIGTQSDLPDVQN